MKKAVLAICAAGLLSGLTACDTKDSSKATATESYTAEEVAFGDSLAEAYGQMLAVQAQQQIQQYKMYMSPEQAENFDMDKYVKALKEFAKLDTADMSTFLGTQMGMQLWGAAKGIPAQLKTPAPVAKMIKGFESVMKLDSVENPYAYQEQFQALATKAQTAASEKELKMLNESEESVANIAAGTAYADSLVNNAGYTRSETGLVYLITEPGSTDKVEKNSRIKLRYKGMHIDGTLFDQTREEPMTSYANHFIPGFTEGLTLLGKGGKATIVIPGELAYGPRGSQPKIGANETLVF
ncbi:MAG: FKBP-type peptidyl-prolyl cis-trans isomerase, partial [Muribaculaceae bacterium]|nr:FKBP-type peptidyl-prolyl cis-trans isomerase [Muribaculaceae bacterium]